MMNFNVIEVVILLHLGINIISFILFLVDKFKAIFNKWRIRERTLIFFLVLGPFGGLYAMLLFRHKIRKKRFMRIGIGCSIVTAALYIGFFLRFGF